MDAVYDKAAAQKVPMNVGLNGHYHEVVFHFKPLDDDLIVRYLEGEDDGQRSPAEDFFDAHIESAEGVEYNGLDDLKEQVPPKVKADAVREGLLGSIRKALPKATGKINWRKVEPQQSYPLVNAFDGGEVETTLTLATAEQEHLRVYRALERRAFPVRFGDKRFDSLAQGMIGLYEALSKEAKNYAPAGVPKHHQMLVIGFHLRGYSEVVLGK